MIHFDSNPRASLLHVGSFRSDTKATCFVCLEPFSRGFFSCKSYCEIVDT